MPMMKKTTQQNRKIWALASQLGLREIELRDIVESVSTKRTISGLSFRHAHQVIQELEALVTERRRKKKRVGPASTHVNAGQLKYIDDLCRQIGWDEWDLRAWLKRYFGVQHEEWLSASKATKVITALKNMKARQDQETNA